MASIGTLIWVSVRPLLRLVICASCGFIITKADIFPLVAARGTGQILLHITLPALFFSKIVPAFTSQNVGALGPLVLVAVIYEALGVLLAWIVKQFFWVPHRFRYGILIAGGWSNVGDVPTAVIMSVTGAAPFNPSTDQTLAVAYLSAFIIVFFITLFPMGFYRLIAWDYIGPEVDDEELRMGVSEKTRESIRKMTHSISAVRRRFAHAADKSSQEGVDAEKQDNIQSNDLKYCDSSAEKGRQRTGDASEIECIQKEIPTGGYESRTALSAPISQHQQQKHVSFHDAEADDVPTVVLSEQSPSQPCSTVYTAKDSGPSRITSPSPSVTQVDSESTFTNVRNTLRHVRLQRNRKQVGANGDDTGSSPGGDVPKVVGPSTTAQPTSRALRHRILAQGRNALSSMNSPQAITIFTALIIALVPPLKALFTPIDNSPIPNAPDGQPPLAFILDTASFIGAASVPMGLVCLGSALARLRVPRSQWGSLPLGAIFSLAVGKMVLMPVIGVLMVQGLTFAGIISAEDKVLRFVCIFLSCIPTATTQVYLTQVYSGTGEATALSAFLIPQYALMFVTMTILSAYTLSLLF
ncbi:auxin efflux carrier [Fomitiporia mediterranea MF3/22]|uniref:auxin efflux carrier n=1 Tax=Fomitiporia mediterranea (strain MF3/22) TaxID=694068 RepID=UPI0004408A62|nr:auxin efflux carrier [Fomitiporia mediterranea MF3/22]EJD04584.1 auxin efflux carrier [Fomitiporia mediterranea MF3/22]